MRHSEVTGLEPANDNPKPAGQGDLFRVREIEDVSVTLGQRIDPPAGHVDGISMAMSILERGDGPVEAVA